MALGIKYGTDSRLEQIQMFISIYSALKRVWITANAMRALAVFIDYGVNAESKALVMSMLEIGVGSYRNLLTKLKIAGLLRHKGYRDGYEVVPDLLRFRNGEDIHLLITIKTPNLNEKS